MSATGQTQNRFGAACLGGSQMPGYYAYIIGEDGHITNRVDVISPDDDEAKRLAKQLVDGHAVELWHEARMVERFEPKE